MNVFAIPFRSVELWRQTTPDVTGWNAQPGAFAEVQAEDGALYSVCVREYPCAALNGWLGYLTGTGHDWIHRPPVFADSANHTGRRVALLENPVARIVAVWQYAHCNRRLREIDPRRFAGGWGCSFPEFVRWIMLSDPLMIDPLLRPQWAMVPKDTRWLPADRDGLQALAKLTGAEMSRPVLPEYEHPRPGLVAESIIREIYAADIEAWEALETPSS